MTNEVKDMVADMNVDKVDDMKVDEVADMKEDMVTKMKVDMEVDKVANMDVNMVADIRPYSVSFLGIDSPKIFQPQGGRYSWLRISQPSRLG